MPNGAGGVTSEREDTRADRRFEFFSSLALDWPTLTPMVCRQAGRFSCTALGFTYLHITKSVRVGFWERKRA